MKLSRICKDNYAVQVLVVSLAAGALSKHIAHDWRTFSGILGLTTEQSVRLYGIFILTLMPSDPEAKRKTLQTTGTFNPRAARVRHLLFQQSSFFDPEDLLQLKYETLRSLEVDHCPVAQAAREFGLSRPTIYEAQSQFQRQGLEGLLPHKRGPKAAHKLTEEVFQYCQEQTMERPEIKAEELARRVRQRFGVTLHPRTIQKALKSKAKRGHPT